MLLSLYGCIGGPEQLQPESFYARRQGPADVTSTPYDKSGPLQYNASLPNNAQTKPPEPEPMISRTVADNVLPPGQAVARLAATAPTTQGSTGAAPTTRGAASSAAGESAGGTPPGNGQPGGANGLSGAGPSGSGAPASGAPAATGAAPGAGGLASGQYMVLGTMVAEVNGTPIFANKVLTLLEPTLRAKARELDDVHYKLAAEDFIQKQVQELVRSELEYAAAVDNLDDEARNAADALTTQWRQRQVTDAGGSEELARRKAAADGVDFDDAVREQYRNFMTQIYYQKKVIPRIVVTPTMMQEYYRDHVETDFTQHDHVTFRLIKIDPDDAGSKEDALAKIKSIRDRAAAGEDFAALASTENDDPGLRSILGEVSVDKGAFVLDDVEDAAFNTPPGQLTDIIYTHGAYYLAKVESRTQGKVTPFSDQALQDQIRAKLRSEQFRALREQEQKKLESEAIVRIDPSMLDATVEMAMQNYPVWSK
jgi:parvulin-like peptidyl-prolyl isomerase